MKSVSYAQHRRQEVRAGDGTYRKGNICEACGKSAPLADYVSNPWSLSVSGRGLVLCARKRCIQQECPEGPGNEQAAADWFAERARVLLAQGIRVG